MVRVGCKYGAATCQTIFLECCCLADRWGYLSFYGQWSTGGGDGDSYRFGGSLFQSQAVENDLVAVSAAGNMVFIHSSVVVSTFEKVLIRCYEFS